MIPKKRIKDALGKVDMKAVKKLVFEVRFEDSGDNIQDLKGGLNDARVVAEIMVSALREWYDGVEVQVVGDNSHDEKDW